MAKLTRKDILELQKKHLGSEEPFIFDNFHQIDSARTMVRKHCLYNRELDYKTRTKALNDGKFVLFITLFEKGKAV